jgi:ABC-type phosphate transport system permease subunit
MAILPILFICFGLGELSKIVLIVFGVAPVIARDLQGRVQEIPRELLTKAQTLGASTWRIIVRVILPLVLPRLIEAVRLSLGAAWLFLIAAEADTDIEAFHGDDPIGRLPNEYSDIREVAHVKKAGHMLQMERSDEVNALMLKFMSTLS